MDDQRYELETGKVIERERRVTLLGPLLTETEFNEAKFRARSLETRLPVKVLTLWHRDHCEGGEDALIPHDWTELDDKARGIMQSRYEAIKPYVDEPVIYDMAAILAGIAARLDCSTSTARRLFNRHRIGGVWGLSPTHDPTKKPPTKSVGSAPRDIGTLDDTALQTMYERLDIIKSLAEKPHVTQSEVAARAREVGKSERTIWNYLAAKRRSGLAGLAPRKRQGKSQLDERMVQVIIGLRLSKPSCTYVHIHERVVEIAQKLGQSIPSIWQVRKICHEIPDQLYLFGTNSTNAFRNKYRLSGTMRFFGIVFQMDHTLINVLALDSRKPRFRKSGGGIRLWLTTCIDTTSRLVLAWRISYDKPNRHTVASVIRESILARPGGLPDEIWVDNGKELISHHVWELTREMGITLHPIRKGTPEHNGRQERFFRTTDARLWRKTPGYVGRSVAHRPQNVKAELVADEIVARFAGFADKHNHTVHRALGTSPIDFWTKNFFMPPIDEADVRLLDMLLLESDARKVGKQGIQYGNRIFWHPEIAPYVGTWVMIRADTRYSTPDTIEVFCDEHHICTAVAIDYEEGVSSSDIVEAKERQAEFWGELADSAKMALKKAEEEVGVTKPAQNGGVGEQKSASPTVVTNPAPTTPTRRNDALLRIYNKQNNQLTD